MIRKRFVLNNIVERGTVSFWDTEKEVVLNASHSLDLLNKFNNENKELREINEWLWKRIKKIENSKKYQ